MIRCRTCVLPNTRPDTFFDESGQCSACIAYAKRPEVDWEQRMRELVQLLDRHGGRCIVPSSGGKDSTYQVLRLLEIGAKPLVVTASTCHLTPIGRRNIDNLARFADTIEVTPNRTRRAKLNRMALEMVGDISWPEHVSIFTTPFRLAAQTGIKLMFYGENPQAEYGGPTPDTQQAMTMTRRWVTEFGGFLGLRPSDFEQMGYDMTDYMPPPVDVLANLEAHFLGQYEPWDSHRNAEKAIANGFNRHHRGFDPRPPTRANWWTHENLDNAQTGIHDFFGWLKYGYGRGAAQISVDIRKGKIDRPAALEWVSDYDGLFPERYMGVTLEEVLEHIGVDRDAFLRACNAFMNRDLFIEPRVEWGAHLKLKAFA